MNSRIIAGAALCLLMGNAWAGPPITVPEPESISLLIAGAGAFGLLRWLRKRQ